jgi:hypothetical protein
MPPTTRGLWVIDQEWRDQVIAQLIYLRTAIYFVAFVVSVGLAAPYAQMFGLPKDSSAFIFGVVVVVAAGSYWRAYGKTMRIEKRVMGTDYGDTGYDDNN